MGEAGELLMTSRPTLSSIHVPTINSHQTISKTDDSDEPSKCIPGVSFTKAAKKQLCHLSIVHLSTSD